MEDVIKMLATFAVVLGVLIVIHEFGHFIVAKWFGIRVDVFSVGFGKRLFGMKRGDTDYRVSLIPLGGYVKMAGENLDEQVTGAPDEFMSKPKWQRFCVAVAGPAMNILTALAIPAVAAMVHFQMPAYLNDPARVAGVETNSPAWNAGIRPGDVIVKMDSQENPVWRDVYDHVLVNPDQALPVVVKRADSEIPLTLRVGSRTINQEKIGYSGLRPEDWKIIVKEADSALPAAQAGLQVGDNIVAVNGTPVEQTPYGADQIISSIQSANGQPVSLAVKRGEETVNITATPQMMDGAWRLGFSQGLEGMEVKVVRLGPLAALSHSVDENLRIIRLTKTALVQVISGQRSARDTFSGPIGIARISGEAQKQGTSAVIQLMALLSLNLGIFNLFPIPVLDGGLIFMLLLESVLGLFGLQLTLRIKEKMMQVGFVMLVLLMGFVIFNDISKSVSFGGGQPQQTEQQQPADK